MLLRGRQVKGKLAAAAVAVTLGIPAFALAATSTPPQPEALNADPNVHWFAAWDINTEPNGTPDFIATPGMGSGVAFMQTQLNNSATANKPLGIKVTLQPLSAANATALFNSHYPLPSGPKAISYVFADFEGSQATMTSQTQQLVQQVRGSTWSTNAYVGEFDLTPLTGPGNAAGQDPTRHGAMLLTKTQYDSTKVNMANTLLYPGSNTFRNRANAAPDWGNANIRTALFVAPIGRMTAVQNVIDSSYGGGEANLLTLGTKYHKQIGWVTRFNNAGNIALDSDNTSSDGYKFIPGAPLTQDGLSSTQTQNQMVGRGDFSAQMMQYRMRGMYSFNLFQPGVLNAGTMTPYTAQEQYSDARYGWYGAPYAGNTDDAAGQAAVAHVNTVFAATDSKRATMTFNPIIDGTTDPGNKRAENSGTIWSGEYSLSLKKLDVLESNLDTMNHQIKFGTIDVYDVFTVRNGSGYTYADNSLLAASRNSLIEAGMHRLLQFDLVTTRVYNSLADMNANNTKYSTKTIWLLNNANGYQVFTNNNRNDVGIPEPTTFGMLAAAGSMAAVCRRHRRNKAEKA